MEEERFITRGFGDEVYLRVCPVVFDRAFSYVHARIMKMLHECNRARHGGVAVDIPSAVQNSYPNEIPHLKTIAYRGVL